MILFFFSFKVSTAFSTPSNLWVIVLPLFDSTKVCSYFVSGATFAFQSNDAAGLLASFFVLEATCVVASLVASVVSFVDSNVDLD